VNVKSKGIFIPLKSIQTKRRNGKFELFLLSYANLTLFDVNRKTYNQIRFNKSILIEAQIRYNCYHLEPKIQISFFVIT